MKFWERFIVEVNNSPTARFLILAKTEAPIDSVTRVGRNRKFEFRGIASVELGFSEKYGYQLVLVAFGEEGKYAEEIITDYPIDRPRMETPIPSAYTKKFLQDLARNAREALIVVREWERGRGL